MDTDYAHEKFVQNKSTTSRYFKQANSSADLYGKLDHIHSLVFLFKCNLFIMSM